MKKLLVFSLCIVLMSCSNDDESVKESINSNLNQILSEKNAATQRVMYNLLSKEEKYTLWTNKTKKILAENNLSAEQIHLITDLQNNLNIDYFDSSIKSDEKEIFRVVYVKNFIEKARKLFSDEFINNSFYTINSSKTDTGGSIGSGGATPCSCDKDRWFLPCGISLYSCKDPVGWSCENVTQGCGFLGQDTCNGVCG